MRKGQSLMGLSVVDQQGGKKLGTVKDLLFDHESDQLLAFVLENKDLFGLMSAVIVPWREVKSIAGDVVMVTNTNSPMKLNDDPQMRVMANRETALSGTQVLSQDGKHIGTLADMFIDESSGQVVGYEVSGGFFADTLRGKKFVPAPPGLAIGKDAAIASPQAEARIKQ